MDLKRGKYLASRRLLQSNKVARVASADGDLVMVSWDLVQGGAPSSRTCSVGVQITPISQEGLSGWWFQT